MTNLNNMINGNKVLENKVEALTKITYLLGDSFDVTLRQRSQGRRFNVGIAELNSMAEFEEFKTTFNNVMDSKGINAEIINAGCKVHGLYIDQDYCVSLTIIAEKA